ncbi:MAG: hypothetical protein WED34_06915 [Planctomycetales bacterium]
MTDTTTVADERRVTRTESAAPGTRPLNAIDQTMLAAHRALRSMHAAGFETQTLVWSAGRIDAERLRRAVARLGRRSPVITARLVDEHGGVSPHWVFPRGDPPLREVDLASAEDAAVREYAAWALVRPRDLSVDAPLDFHLLRRPDGRDVLLLQSTHALMDYGATAPLIRRLDRLSGDDAAAAESGDDDAAEPPDEHRDRIADYLARFPRGRRMMAALRAADLRLRVLRGTAVRLGQPLPVGQGGAADRPAPCVVLNRSLGSEESRALQRRATETCGLSGVSMAVLGSAFRAVSDLAPPRRRRGGKYVAGIGLDLGLRNGGGPLFQNLCSLVPVGVRQEMLADRSRLVQELHRQLRDRLERGIDLGVVQLASIFRRSRQLDRTTRARLESGYSLWYAFFGGLDAAGERFCGERIERISCVGPAWSPLGLTLIVTQYRGRMEFQATCLPESVSVPLAERFLDRVLGDLAEFCR